MRDSCRILVGGYLKEIAQLKDLGVNGKIIIIKQIFKQWERRHGLERSGQEEVVDFCECVMIIRVP
jgi:hypothetical protein